MRRSALFVITSDPRTSHRTSEAVRIAAGVAAWKNVDVTLCLWNTATLALSEITDDLVNEENFRNYWPMLAELNCPVYVQRGTPWLARLGNPPVKFELISEDQLAHLAGDHHSLLRF